MEKNRFKKYIAWLCIAAVVVVLAVMPLLASTQEKTDGPEASILHGTASRQDIQSVLIGGGTLQEESPVEITIPSGVRLTQFLAANGDSVTQGDPIAKADRISIMSAIAGVQQTLEYLAEEIETASEDENAGEIPAPAGGIVKLLYAQEGDSAADVMLEHGALAVVSLDGLMAVQLKTDASLSAGDTVTVTLSDGTEVEGKVASNLDGILVITINDEGYAIGETVQVYTETGAMLGSGSLYICHPWNAVAYNGTVSELCVSEGEEVDSGDTLLELEDTGYTAEFQSLADQRREYEALMLELFRLYQDEIILSPGDGVISGIDEESAVLLAAQNTGWKLELLTNAPNGDDDSGYLNYIGQVSDVGIDGLVLKLNPQTLQITDYKDLTGVPTDPAAMTMDAVYAAQAPVYELAQGEWVQIDSSAIAAGDILLFAADESGNFVWVVRVAQAMPGLTPPVESTPPGEPTIPSGPAAAADPTESTEATVPSTEPTAPSGPAAATEPTVPSSEPVQSGSPTIPSGQSHAGISVPSGSGYSQIGGTYSGSALPGTMPEEEPEFELYSLETVTVASVTGQETLTVEITVDELDVLSLFPGQTADITIGALPGEHFTGTITEISNSGANEGGNSKFTAQLTLQRSGDMLPGMNATASIALCTAADVLSVPVAALNDDGTRTYLYTGFDEETQQLCDPVTVTVGVCDGENAEILSGLAEGTAYYYAYYDTLELSNTPRASGFSFRR